MSVENWPTWGDGKPVKVGEVAMSSIGPLRIDGIVIENGGWALLSNQSMFQGAPKWWYVIDSGEFGEYEEHPVRNGEPCEFWQEGDETMPEFVFAPLSIAKED